MAIRQDWSRLEVEACVADYLQMLTLELSGQRYSKTDHANALMQKLEDRGRPSIEFKHCNISAVMVSLGYPYIDGYKPRGNYQALLLDVIEEQLQQNLPLQEAALAAVQRPATPVSIESDEAIWVPPPKPAKVGEPGAEYTPRFSASRRDFLAQEARNHSLGRAGELFVLEVEARRLHAEGQKKLANRVEHVAGTHGDGLGFDVLSFESNGRERLIEVKTTAFGELTPFYVSRNEIARSETNFDQYQLYRLFDFRDRPRLFALPGKIAAHCRLDAMSYLAQLTG